MDLKYTIQSGDTLSQIAVDLGVEMRELAAANQIEDANKIRAGKQLIIPPKKEKRLEEKEVQQIERSMQRQEKPTLMQREEKQPVAVERSMMAKQPVAVERSMMDKAVDFFIPSASASTKPSLMAEKKPAPTQTIEQVPASDPTAMSTAPFRLFSKFIQRKVQSELLGKVDDIEYTEKDFTENEVSSLYEIASNAWKKGKSRIDYQDYGDKDLEKGIRNLGQDALTSATNVKAQLALTIGQAKVAEEDGRLVLYDTYDFSKIKSTPESFYGKVRKWAGDIGQEGSFPIRMDLGPAPKV